MHIYEIKTASDETMFYAAQSDPQARAAYEKDWSDPITNLIQIPDAELEKHSLELTDEDDEPTGELISFLQWLHAEFPTGIGDACMMAEAQ